MSFFGDLWDTVLGGAAKTVNPSTSTSVSSSTEGGASSSSSFGLSGSQGQQSSLGTSVSGGQSSTTQSIAFEDLFAKLFGGANAAAAGVNTAGITGAANRLFSGGVDFLGQLQGGAGQDALKARIGDTSARDAQLGALKTSLGDLFNEQLLPGITSQAVSAGTLGGSREAIAQAQAAKAVGGQFAQGAAQIIGTDQAQRDAAAAQLAGIDVSGAQAGLAALPGLFGLANAGANAPLDVFGKLASIYGGPTVLSQSSAQQSATATDIANAMSSSFGQQGSQSYGFNFGQSDASSSSVGSVERGGQQGLLGQFFGAVGGMF